VLLTYTCYVSVLKWLSLSLFVYFGTVVTVFIPWHQALHGLFVPTWQNSGDFVALVVAVLGTTISPYLYFWQSSQEAEDQREQPQREKLTEAPEQAPAAYERIRSIPGWTWRLATSSHWQSCSLPERRCTLRARRTSTVRKRPPRHSARSPENSLFWCSPRASRVRG
jgi:hypothetical protein